jgi:hypothetical protein
MDVELVKVSDTRLDYFDVRKADRAIIRSGNP